MRAPALHLSPLAEVLAAIALMFVGPVDLEGPPRGLRVTTDASACSEEARPPVEVTLHLTTRGLRQLEARGRAGPSLSLEAALTLTRAEHPGARSLGLRVDDAVEVEQLVSVIDRFVAAGFDDLRLAPR
ncbi:MAG: hypothetical protein SFW67_21710 [Myxococcaceae bacterium]|nr:hypothetical protein [Myxococcaceae bacterium]